MIVGLLGKGGSGKSTIATLLTKYLLENKKQVLAIDADHNMDFSYNLGLGENISYFGGSLADIKNHIGLEKNDNFKLAFLTGVKERFGFFPSDEFTKNYSNLLGENLQVMVAGPHTEEVWVGNSCSHSLFTSLKVYLPFLNLRENQCVVIDEKAGMDPVGTMVPVGFDFAIIVCEPTLHSLKAARQIASGLEKYKTPYVLVGNKITTQEQRNFLESNIYGSPLVNFEFDVNKIDPSKNELTDLEKKNFDKIIEHGKSISISQIAKEKRCSDYWLELKKKQR